MKEYTIRHKEYISIILGYIVIVTLLSLSLDYIFCPVYGDVLLYTDEARSLADSGTLKFANMYGVSGAYLYPLIISLVYKFFYNAYTIVFWVRFVIIIQF